MAKNAVYPDKDTEKTFKAEQEKREKPDCFGEYGKPGFQACRRCWFHPECKVYDKAAEKAAAEAKKKSIEMDAIKGELRQLGVKFKINATLDELVAILDEAKKAKE